MGRELFFVLLWDGPKQHIATARVLPRLGWLQKTNFSNPMRILHEFFIFFSGFPACFYVYRGSMSLRQLDSGNVTLSFMGNPNKKLFFSENAQKIQKYIYRWPPQPGHFATSCFDTSPNNPKKTTQRVKPGWLFTYPWHLNSRTRNLWGDGGIWPATNTPKSSVFELVSFLQPHNFFRITLQCHKTLSVVWPT